jgi:hypothetical protein
MCAPHTLHWSCHCWKHWQKAFGIFWSSAITFELMSSMVVKHAHLSPIFRVGNSHSEWDSESTMVGWWQECFSQWELLHNKRCVTQCIIVMQKPLSLSLVVLLPPNFITQPLQNLHIEMASNTLSRWSEFILHQTICKGIPGTFWLPIVLCQGCL